jgi:hypothetical protein
MVITLIDPRLIKEVAAMAAEKRGFVRLPLSALQDKRLTMSDAAVLAVILDRCDDRSVQLSAATIASAAGCCVRTAKSAISKLEDCGYIRVERSVGAQSAFSCPDVLPPKRRWKNAPQSKQEDDLTAYESVINQFLY